MTLNVAQETSGSLGTGNSFVALELAAISIPLALGLSFTAYWLWNYILLGYSVLRQVRASPATVLLDLAHHVARHVAHHVKP